MSPQADPPCNTMPVLKGAPAGWLEKEKNVVFYKKSHSYGTCTSVTRTVSKIATFDAKAIIQRNMASWSNNQQSQYFGKSAKEIEAMWEKEKEKGTLMHERIERHLLRGTRDGCGAFQFLKQLQEHPVATEYRIADERLRIAGTIDLITHNPKTNSFSIVDWKRSRSFLGANSTRFLAHRCLRHLHDCKLTVYSLQLSMYRLLLERIFHVTVDNLLIVRLIPPEESGYEVVRALDLRKEAMMLIRLQLARHKWKILRIVLKLCLSNPRAVTSYRALFARVPSSEKRT